jgi:hypothetical protein
MANERLRVSPDARSSLHVKGSVMNRPVFMIFLSLLLGCLNGLYAQWQHLGPAQAEAGAPLLLVFDNPAESVAPLEALLHLELDGVAISSLDPLELAAGRLEFELPAGLTQGLELAYRLELRYDSGRVMLPASGIWRLPLTPAAGGNLIEVLSSLNVAAGEEALLAFSSLSDKVDLAASRLMIDGAAVEGVEADPWLLTWSGELSPGTHSIELGLVDSKGRALPTQRFQLMVLDPGAIPGGFTADAWQEFNMDYQKDRSEEWSRYHAGQLRFKAWRGEGANALRLSGRVLLSALDFESDILQPQSRVTLDLDWKAFKLGVGDRQPDFGEGVLFGTRVRGLELGIDTKPFGLRLVSGTTREALDAVIHEELDADSLVSPRWDFVGSYERRLHGLDLRFGPKNGTVETGISLIKVKDEVDGPSLTPGDFGITPGDPTEDRAAIAPVDNLVTALRLNINAFRGHFTGRNQIALSLNNTDISNGAIADSVLEDLGAEDLPFNPSDVEDIIVINEYFSPLDLADGDVMNSAAIFSNWALVAGRNEATLSFRRVGAAYLSLGNPFVTPDQQEIRLSDRFRFMQNQVYVDLGGNLVTDNLDGQYDESVGTTTRQGLNLGLGWYPRGRDFQARLGVEQIAESNESLDLFNSFLSDPEHDPDLEASRETSALSQHLEGTTTQLRLGLSGGVEFLDRRNRWSFTVVNQAYSDDAGEVLNDQGDKLRNDRSFSSNQVSLGWKTGLPADLGLNLGLAFYASDYDDPALSDYNYISLRSALDRDWLDGKLSSEVRLQLQQIGTEREEDAATISADYLRTDLGFRLGWRIREGLNLSSRLEWQGYSGDRDDSYMRVVCRLSQSF